MTPQNELRLLPWTGHDGKPCYLSTDNSTSHLSRLADNTEAIQLGLAADLVAHVLEVLNDERTDPDELRRLTADLTDALKDTLRVATSRGHRLSAPDVSTRDGNEGPRLPAAALG
ncbi:hypothetical protein [Streptomyces lateritius]|uniref:hypothetical protein n=1 Tax=Streptomyces lateritius TaxID=67313 RepID=UPI001677430C|nr:hypothetical protein [Streptomyces lateritius]GGU09499.1 hypothetical protein GCM10010272_63330 [Streptomyces lateritius]